MQRYEEEQERIRAVKMFRIVKRALTLDQRSKIKPTLKNPSLLEMSAYRGGGPLTKFATDVAMGLKAVNECKCLTRPQGPKEIWSDYDKEQLERRCNNKDAIKDYREMREKDPAGYAGYLKAHKC